MMLTCAQHTNIHTEAHTHRHTSPLTGGMFDGGHDEEQSGVVHDERLSVRRQVRDERRRRRLQQLAPPHCHVLFAAHKNLKTDWKRPTFLQSNSRRLFCIGTMQFLGGRLRHLVQCHRANCKRSVRLVRSAPVRVGVALLQHVHDVGDEVERVARAQQVQQRLASVLV